MFKKGDIVKTESHDAEEPWCSQKRLFVVIDVVDEEVLTACVTSNLEDEGLVLPEDSVLDGSLKTPVLVNPKKLHSLSSRICEYVFTLKKVYFEKILRSVLFYFTENYHEAFHAEKSFIPGETSIRYAGRVYDKQEMTSLIDSCLDFWLTAGRFAQQFEQEFAQFLGVEHCVLTNSGSSANLLALSALTSPKLGDKRLQPGDEVITTACAFPTTVNPILQNNLLPVFLDVDIGTYNILADQIEAALSERTQAIFLAHTLGNPFDVERVMNIAQKHHLWVIEDTCDALGTTYNGQYVGTYGHIATFSFYAAHHITMGEGGALVTNDTQLKRLIESFRDWGRDCWCGTGHDNTCGKRFGWQLGTLPFGYDHKYIYSHRGYNLKITDMQAAIGVEQLKKLPKFIEARKKNWMALYEGVKNQKKFFILPQITEHSEPSWFGFPVTVKKDAPFSRDEIVTYLEDHKIATRTLFAGNILRHPGFEHIPYRIHGNLKNTDRIMNDTFWIGVYPGLTKAMMDFMISKICEFVEKVSDSHITTC